MQQGGGGVGLGHNKIQREQWYTLRCYMDTTILAHTHAHMHSSMYMEMTTLSDVLKKISGTYQQSPLLTTNADKVCIVRHIKLLSDIGIIEMCTVCPCQLDNCKLQCAISKHLHVIDMQLSWVHL